MFTCMQLFFGKVLVLYHSKICSEKMHISVTLDFVADKLLQSVQNLNYRFIFTGTLMVLLCLHLAIVSLVLFLLQFFSHGHILQLFAPCAFLNAGL